MPTSSSTLNEKTVIHHSSSLSPTSALPDLNYTLHTRKLHIFIFWTLILLDTLVLPITLYFALFFGTSLSHNAVFSISTGALGSVSILEYFLRWWRLWNSKVGEGEKNCRPIGAGKLYVRVLLFEDCGRFTFTLPYSLIGSIGITPSLG
jgi:hypothetical protein